MPLPCARRLLLALSWLAFPGAWQGLHASDRSSPAHQEILARLSLEDATLTVTSQVTPAANQLTPWTFVLDDDATPTLTGSGTQLQRLPSAGEATRRYRVTPAPDQKSFTVSYQIQLDRPTEGVLLSASDYWYPTLPDTLVTFDLNLILPPGWLGMSQGSRSLPGAEPGERRERWQSPTPQEQIYLLAGPFNEYIDVRGDIEAMALLRTPEEALASQYLAATHHYIDLYQDLLGDYPYPKFALVENVQETGYGMPSFTLLGSRVIRLPFILHSSYPHEILHNWWGNGVYTDYASGNWAEGLTSYLADHMLREQQGRGVEYRRDTLQKYADYVSQEDDFPLSQFRGRHNAPTQAVGYGKTLMVWHMLRRSLGDETFISGLRRFYQDNRFTRAGFDSLEAAFGAASGADLEPFFRQWVERTGAPQLTLGDVNSGESGGVFELAFTLEQVQPGPPYRLQIPLAVTLQGQDEAWQTDVTLTQASQRFKLVLPGRPLHLTIDPHFDLFRRLHPTETPASIGQALGAEQLLLVLPDAAPAAMKQAYRELAESWLQGQADRVEITLDTRLSEIPGDRSVWLLGWQNALLPPSQRSLPTTPSAPLPAE